MIDLRSDTVTQPTPAMREAMAHAEVGDDVYGDDPTVRALEARTAELLGKDDAVYMPTGTMTNQVALRAHTEAGDEILAESGAHIFVNEGGAPAGLAGILVRTIAGEHGIFTADQLEQAIRTPHRFNPSTIAAPTKLVCLENTHNSGGGTIWPLETMQEVAGVARRHGIPLHLDGARLWHASVATGIPEADYAGVFDTVSVCFSKGLGAPVGSALAGAFAFIERARRFKQMFGGGVPASRGYCRGSALRARAPPSGSPGRPQAGGDARRGVIAARRRRARYDARPDEHHPFSAHGHIVFRARRAMPREGASPVTRGKAGDAGRHTP